MRLVTYAREGQRRLGALVGQRVVDLNRAYVASRMAAGEPAALAAALVPPDLRALLALGQPALDACAAALAYVAERADDPAALRAEGLAYDLAEVRLCAPLPEPGKIICLGLNYRDHAAETKGKVPEYPILFSKYTNSICGPGDPIILPRVTQKVDYEAELAFVIGRRGKNVPRERALDYVAGYMNANDVSARDYQLRVSQWMTGKTFDTFCPIGPALVLKDEVPDPHNLPVRLSINGEVLQDSNTRELIFNVYDLVAYISSVMTLEPGDLVLTGTPAGVGFVREPSRYLRPGDRVRIEIGNLGVLENPVVAEA